MYSKALLYQRKMLLHVHVVEGGWCLSTETTGNIYAALLSPLLLLRVEATSSEDVLGREEAAGRRRPTRLVIVALSERQL